MPDVYKRQNKELKRKNEKLQKALRKQDLNFIILEASEMCIRDRLRFLPQKSFAL